MYRIIYRHFGETKIHIVIIDDIGAKNMVVNDYDIEILAAKKFLRKRNRFLKKK